MVSPLHRAERVKQVGALERSALSQSHGKLLGSMSHGALGLRERPDAATSGKNKQVSQLLYMRHLLGVLVHLLVRLYPNPQECAHYVLTTLPTCCIFKNMKLNLLGEQKTPRLNWFEIVTAQYQGSV